MMMNKRSIFFKSKIDRTLFTTRTNTLLYDAIKNCLTILDIEPNPMNIYEVEPGISAGDIAEIYSIFNGDTNYQYYEGLIIEAFRKKAIESSLHIRLSELSDKKADQVITGIENDISDIFRTTNNSEISKIGDHIGSYIDEIQANAAKGAKIVGLPTAWENVNSYTLGFQPELLYIIGARPSKGKTAAVLNILSYLTLHKKIPCGFLSLESGRHELLGRLASAESSINLSKLKLGNIDLMERSTLDDTMKLINEAPLYITDKPNMTLSEVCSTARRMVVTKKIQLLAVDYLQIVDAEIDTQFKRDKVSHVSLTLKQLARQLKIPIIALAQLNRVDANKPPTLVNLAESGQIERDADSIIFLHHKDDESWFIFAKQRDGPTGNINMYFDRPKVRFRERV